MDRWFAALADEFIARVRAANVGSATEVVLIFHCVDQGGQPVPPVRTSLEPTTKVSFPGNRQAAGQFAASMHVGTIIDNVNSIVRHAPLGLTMLRDGPQVPVIIRDFSLEIN